MSQNSNKRDEPLTLSQADEVQEDWQEHPPTGQEPVTSDAWVDTQQNQTSHPLDEGFSYRPMPPTAPVSLVIGLVSLLALLTEFILPLTLAGVLVGFLAVKRIRRFPNEYSGLWIAQTGLVLCIGLIPASIAIHTHTYMTEVPEGYRRLHFNEDISKKEFIFDQGRNAFHPDVKELGEQKIFIKGYMLPDKRTEGIREFILCRDSGDCCFGGQPAVTDMIMIRAPEDGEPFEYHPGMVFVAGTFKLLVPNSEGATAAYKIEATHFGPARTFY